MKNYNLYAAMVFLLIANTQSYSRDPQWHENRIKDIEFSMDLPKDQRIQHLGKIVGAVGSNEQMDLEQEDIYRKARSALIKIPGHAEYFREKLNKIYNDAVLEYERMNGARTFYYLNYHEKGHCLLALRYIQSPEAIRVLGEMLDDIRSSDPQNRPPREWKGDGPSMPFGWEAARILTEMELSGAPMKQFIFPDKEEFRRMTAEEYYNLNIEPWRLWYAQVKAGTRTFRFKDDPQEYNLDGPVTAALVPSPASRKPGGTEEAQDPSGGRFNPWPLTASLLVLAAAGGWYLRRRKGFV